MSRVQASFLPAERGLRRINPEWFAMWNDIENDDVPDLRDGKEILDSDP